MALRKRSEAQPGGSLADQLAASLKGAEEKIAADLEGALMLEKNQPAPQPTIPAPPPLYQSANLGEGVNADFQRIIETTYAADAFRDYDDLERHLEVGDQRGDYATLREHLDKAEARARRAHKLYLGSKLELVKWDLDSKRVVAGMRKRATEMLQDDPDRTKRITNDDVEAKMADEFPDEVSAQEIRRAKMKGVVEDLEHLVRRWDSKCVDLRTMIETLRK